jgi:hypothetical protein
MKFPKYMVNFCEKIQTLREDYGRCVATYAAKFHKKIFRYAGYLLLRPRGKLPLQDEHGSTIDVNFAKIDEIF